MGKMNKALEAARKARKEGNVKSRREKFEERPTRKLAIDLMCLHCLGGEGEPGVRNQVRNCTSVNCPLYIYRPYK